MVPSGLYTRHCHAFSSSVRSANLLEGLYILPFRNFFFFTRSKGISVGYLLDRFSRSFHQMEGICVNFLDHVHFFQFLKGRCQPILCRKQNTNRVRFLQFLHHMKAFWMWMMDLKFFFNISRDVAMTINFYRATLC